ncbi:O-antigen ligase family protein [Methyloligella sp. GL2]|uniref:O-antigen ligase family protein n=2 Tax=unclassified Methyloligella TaxID=2625955 RepID=UPI00157C9B12|nr:O-antigen ligase family protein [Methyloligella sp. GL2]QKP76085.1 O-antigen ligase family protein [Methyloligella sp. GL2]
MRNFATKLAVALPPLFFLAPLLCIIAPRLTVTTLVVLASVVIVLALLEGTKLRELFKLDLTFVLLIAAGAYLFVNATWSADSERALGKAAVFLLFAVLTYGSVRALIEWPVQRAKAAGMGFALGTTFGLAFLLFELATHQWLARTVYNNFSFAVPHGTKGFVIRHGEIRRIPTFELNRDVGVLLISLWPALLYLFVARGGRVCQALGTILAVGSAIAIYASAHDTSQIALPISLIVFAVALAWPRGAWLGVTAAWCLAFALVIPLAVSAFNNGLHEAEWIPYSGRARIILWAYTAEDVHKAPIGGIGISTTRAESAKPKLRAKSQEAKKKGSYAWYAGPHAHNEYLQTWYELGVIGVILFMAAGAAILGVIGRLASPNRAFMLAHFAAFATISASGWGMWQTWLMALAGLPAIYGALAVVAARKLPAATEAQS